MFYVKNNNDEYLSKFPRESSEEIPVSNEPQSTFRFAYKGEQHKANIWDIETIISIIESGNIKDIEDATIIQAKYSPTDGHKPTVHGFKYERQSSFVLSVVCKSEETILCPYCKEEQDFGSGETPDSVFGEGEYRQEWICSNCKKTFYATRELSLFYITETK